MSLKEEVLIATKSAMKAGEKTNLVVLRGVSAAIKQIEIDEKKELSDSEQLAVMDKLVKQRKDSEKQFREAGRDDLADKEQSELVLLSTFLPTQLTEEEISTLIDKALSEVNETGVSAMGKIMAIIKPQAQGRADMGMLSKLVKERL